MVFDGEVGTGYQGDIALDDISVNSGTCASQTTTLSTQKPMTTVSYRKLHHKITHFNIQHFEKEQADYIKLGDHSNCP